MSRSCAASPTSRPSPACSSGVTERPPARPALAEQGQLLVHTTDGVPVAQRLAYWREGVMRRMVPLAVEGTAHPFHGRMRRIVGDGFELIEYASEDVVAVRSPARCRVDGCDDITIDMMRRCSQ